MLASNTILQNRYRIVRQLGQGGMGTVYEAIDERVSCVVALKETLATNDPEARRAFEREASLLANLRHPLLPRVMDHFSDEHGQFLVMDFIQGHDLAELLQVRGTPFAQAQVLKWADELLRVLEYLHGRQPPILHRDIKPSNLKLTEQGEIFVLDFGLAKGAAGQMPTLLTSRSVHGYTPVYASLEQIHGQGTDPRSDLYSLGATLYHLLTGTQPTDAPTRFTAVEDDRPDPLRPIDEVNPQVSPAIAAVIHEAMAVSRKHRPANASAMRTALREAEDETRSQEETHPPNRQELEKHQAEEEKTRRLAEQSKAARNGVAPTQRAKGADGPITAPGMKTLKGEPAQIYQNADALNSSRAGMMAGEGETEPGKRNDRALLIAIAVVVLLVVTVPVGWMLLRDRTAPDDGSQQVSNGRQTTNQPKTGKANQPPVSTTSAGTPFRNLYGIEMVWIPAGSFEMGSNNGEADEKPVHRVTINQGFFLGKYEVTQGQWLAVMGSNPSTFKGDNLPVDTVTWNEAIAFIARLDAQNDGFTYRLPTEAEWEYACRSGTTGDYAGDVDAMAWYVNNSGRTRLDAAEIVRTDRANAINRIKENGGQTHAVGSKLPNSFGLFDMHGNVGEWCQDWYHDNYNGAPSDGSAWLSGSEQKLRVLHGGSFFDLATGVRSAVRVRGAPDGPRGVTNGFRVVAVARTQ